jgi:hypothetical protein
MICQPRGTEKAKSATTHDPDAMDQAVVYRQILDFAVDLLLSADMMRFASGCKHRASSHRRHSTALVSWDMQVPPA